MKIAVAGLWHLGLVTAACLSSVGHEVLAFDDVSPISEPGLDDLLAAGVRNKTLCYSLNPEEVRDAEVVWVTYDTPVDENDVADVDFVKNKIKALFEYLKEGALVIISSQLPVGSVREMIDAYQTQYPRKPVHFACSPENLRLGKALQVFLHPDRVIMGLQHQEDQNKVKTLFAPITDQIIFMGIESAEMVKHAINSFLALSVTFINELATLCQYVGADPLEVEQGLKSEARIGPKAYLKPGAAFAGGTLARDISYLIKMSESHDQNSRLFPAILESNHHHKFWAGQAVLHALTSLRGRRIALLGLTYKPGTDTLRRSAAVELAAWLHEKGAIVTAYDPVVKHLPTSLTAFITLKTDCRLALKSAEAVIVATEWPEFQALEGNVLQSLVANPLVVDINGFCEKSLGKDPQIQYIKIGKRL